MYTNTDNNNHSESKASTDIVGAISILVTMIIIPPFLIAGIVIYKNRRRSLKLNRQFKPIISNPITNPNLGYRTVRPDPPAPDRFKPLPPLPVAKPKPLPLVIKYTHPPSKLSISLQKHNHSSPPNSQTWRTSNPPNPISQSSATYSPIDLSDPISPLSTPSPQASHPNSTAKPQASTKPPSYPLKQIRARVLRNARGTRSLDTVLEFEGTDADADGEPSRVKETYFAVVRSADSREGEGEGVFDATVNEGRKSENVGGKIDGLRALTHV